MPSSLQPLQEEFLRAFFVVSGEFYLTDGAALIGFHGWSRQTQDLDLFSSSQEAFAHVDSAVRLACAEIGATSEQLRATAYFLRYLVRRGADSVQVALVYEASPQAYPQKISRDGVMVDPLEEIFASKICTLVHRQEVRDFWDVHEFVARGYSFDRALADAAIKEGGIDAESLLYVLKDIDWSVLRQAAAQSSLAGFDRVERFFLELIPNLSLRLLPPS